MSHIAEALIFGLLGLCIEVIFTGIYNMFLEKKLSAITGHVSLFMYPVYAGSYHIFSFLGNSLQGSIFVNCFVITCLIYFCEYCWGWIYHFLGFKPWYYDHEIKIGNTSYLCHLHHKITVLYLPFWYLFAFLIWYYHIWISKYV